MEKIMLVLDNNDDQIFLEKVLNRLQYVVISMTKGRDLSEQLIDHFPDLVFASTLGKNERILNALGKIKKVRGKPKLVFVKQEKESGRLTEDQKRIIDGVLYSPVDPFKLIDLLASTTEMDLVELRRRYHDMVVSEKGRAAARGTSQEPVPSPEGFKGYTKVSGKVSADYGETQIIGGARKKQDVEMVSGKIDHGGAVHVKGGGKGKEANREKDGALDQKNDLYHISNPGNINDSGSVVNEEVENLKSSESVSGRSGEKENAGVTSSPEPDVGASSDTQNEEKLGGVSSSSSLIHDPERAKRYNQVTDRLKATGEQPTPIDVQVLRQKQAEQKAEIKEEPTIKKDRKHFLKTLFTMDPKSTKKSS